LDRVVVARLLVLRDKLGPRLLDHGVTADASVPGGAAVGHETAKHVDGATLRRTGVGTRVDLDVRLDADAVERATRRRNVVPDGELDGGAVGERSGFLHGPLAEGLRTEDDRAVAVLQRAGDDL